MLKLTRLVLLIVLLIISATSLFSESYFGGESGTRVSMDMDTGDFQNSVIEAEYSLAALLSVFSDNTSLSARLSFSGDIGQNNIDTSLDMIKAEFIPLPGTNFSFGRYNYSPGPAEFISPTDYFGRTNLEKLITGDLQQAVLPNDLIQIGIFYSDFYARVSAAPFRKELALPDVESPWFPDKDIPQSLPWPFDGRSPKLVFQEPTPYTDTLDSMCFSVEAGGTLPGIDFAFIYYNGWDYSPMYSANLSFPIDEPEIFKVEVYPEYRRISSFGLNAVSAVSSFRFWIDGAYTPEKLFQKTRLFAQDNNVSTGIYNADSLTLAAGGSWEPGVFGAVLLFEYYRIFIGEEDAAQVFEPLLHHFASMMVRASFFGYTLHPAIISLLSLTDNSIVVYPSVSYRPTEEFSLQLNIPLFFGEDDTELGQFRDNHTLSIEAKLRF
jgi:hypothetical protein